MAPRLGARSAAAPKPPPPVPRAELVGGVIGDKYAIKGILGEGGMGVVYEAEHMAMGRIVAIKVLHPENAQKREAVTRLQHEAKVTGNLGHPNICEIYDMGRLEDGSPYVVMERLRGETLADKIKDLGKVEPQRTVEIAMQVLAALGAAHASGIIHRDLKPENVFLADKPGGLVVTKLLDFGISKAIFNGDEEGLGLTQTGMVMGTPYYMAPEQARGDRALDNRVDIWAVGVMMYEAMTGKRPFLAKNYNALLVKILTVWHRSLAEVDPTIPPALALVVDKALSKMPEDRYRSAADMQEALRRFLPRSEISYPASFALAPRLVEPPPVSRAQPASQPQPHLQPASQPQPHLQPASQPQPPSPLHAQPPPPAPPAAARERMPDVARAPTAPPQPHAPPPAKPAPPTFGLPELDLHDETADGIPWTAVKQYVSTEQREAVSSAIAEARAHLAAQAGRSPAAPAAGVPTVAAPAAGMSAPAAASPPASAQVTPPHVAPPPAAPPRAAPAPAPVPAPRPAPAASSLPLPPAAAPRPAGVTPPGVGVPPALGLPVPPRAPWRGEPPAPAAPPPAAPAVPPPAAAPMPRSAPASPAAHHARPAPAPAGASSHIAAPSPAVAPPPAMPPAASAARPVAAAAPAAARPVAAAASASPPAAGAPRPSRPAARLSQPGRQLRPLPAFSHEKRTSEPPPETDDDTTILEEPSDDSDDDSETLVLVRDKLSIPKKQP